MDHYDKAIEVVKDRPGLVATTIISGTIEPEFAACREELRSFNERRGLTKVEYRNFYAVFVETGRDSVVQHALTQNYDWILQIDADAVFPPDTLVRLLYDAYVVAPDADAVGAYSQLKGSYICTIDTGTGTWEEHYPGEGLLQAIRTGGHCLFTKCSAFRHFGPPWFRTRLSASVLHVLAELDNISRTNFNNRNPFKELPEWAELISRARKSGVAGVQGAVGEDSAFCDALCAAGGKIYVDTELVAGHIAKELITPKKLRESQKEKGRINRLSVGVLE